uniref:UORF 1 n=1 Tax=Talaromyces marneffei TaxID=37727 RepID=Q8NKF7_TALMA|nr:uORF 1 [Talaromyces marneffei]
MFLSSIILKSSLLRTYRPLIDPTSPHYFRDHPFFCSICDLPQLNNPPEIDLPCVRSRLAIGTDSFGSCILPVWHLPLLAAPAPARPPPLPKLLSSLSLVPSYPLTLSRSSQFEVTYASLFFFSSSSSSSLPPFIHTHSALHFPMY